MPSGRLTILAALLVASLGIMAPATVRTPDPTDGIQQALDALHENDFARAERVATAAAQANQERSWRAWLIVAAAQQRQGRYAKAEDAYRQFLSLCTSETERAYAVEEIRRCSAAASSSKPPVPVSRLLRPAERKALSTVADRRFTESTEHFLVRSSNAEVAKLVARQAEVALARICKLILSAQAYPHSVTIYVWADLKEYQKHAKSAIEWEGGSFRLQHGEDGQVTRRIDLTQLDKAGQFDPVMLDRVLPHEMCHLVLAEYFGDAHCPLALNEGLAMMAEATVDNSRILLAGAALLGPKKISLPELLRLERYNADSADVFYAEAFSLTSYLHGRLTGKQFQALLSQIKAGFPLDEALRRVLYIPPQEDFLKQLARAWECEAIRQLQFLRALETKLAGAS